MNLRWASLFTMLCLPLLSFAQEIAVSSRHFKILEATQRSWSPGTVRENTSPGGGYIYQVNIKVRKKGNYEIQSLITNNQVWPVEISPKSKRTDTSPMRKCSKWELVARSNRNATDNVVEDQLSRIIEGRENAAAWIQYQYEGKTYLAEITSFTAAPAGSPNQ